ncbi:MAG TPA: BBP7 family outer membrane beta-barrel protein [Gemmataceae bacterium]|jgi:hypothetical protein
MRHVLLSSVLAALAGSGLALAQDNSPSEAEAPTPAEQKAAPPNVLPPQPVPARPAPPPPEDLPAPAPTLVPPPTPPPGPPPLAPPLFADAALDGFATRFWLSADYLLWWTKGDHLPPLITTGSPTDAVPGAIGQPGTQVLFGGDSSNQLHSGARFRGGYWITHDQTFGVDGTFFFLGSRSGRFDETSDGVPILTRPFFNPNSNQEDAFLTAFPAQQNGSLAATLSSRLWGADADLRGMLFRGASYQVSLLGGFRFLDLRESLGMKQMDLFLPSSGSGLFTSATTMDRFHTSNQFYGGQIGTDVMWCRGRFYVNVLTKVGFGTSVEAADITGWSTWANSNGQSGRVGVGELALPSNLGHFRQSQFAVVPEVGLNLGYAVTQHIRLTFGYTLIYWSRVLRVGDQVDRVINPTEFTALAGGSMIGPPRPSFTFNDSAFWAQGLNFGLEFRY